MAKTAASIDKDRRKIGAAALALLNDRPLDDLDLGEIGIAAGTDEALTRRLFSSPAAAIEKGLADLDEKVMFALDNDFAEDPDASVRDKILEGLVARYEAYQPFKKAMDHLRKASIRDPVLAAMLVFRLNQASERLLNIAGVSISGITGILQVKGLSGVALSCQREWLRDESPDLAPTIRALDQRLRQAEGIASSLRIINHNQTGPEEDDSQF
jgi:AcrR family transcriptional regulator